MDRRRKVLIIAPTPAPYRAYEYDLVQAGLSGRFEFHTFFLERKFTDMKWTDDVPKKVSWDVLPKSWLCPYLKSIPGFHRLNAHTWRSIQKVNPDILILHGWDSISHWTAFVWAKIFGKPLLCRSDSNILKDTTRSRYSVSKWVKTVPLRVFFSGVDAFLSIGTRNESFYERYGGDPRRFFRSSYMVDVDFFKGIAETERSKGRPLKRELGIKENCVILFVGRFVWEKDIENLLQGFSSALQRLTDCALVLVGDGPKLDVIERVKTTLNHIYTVGFQQPEGVAALLGMSDVFVLPSIREAWGLVINEAMAAGLPIISSDRVGAALDLVIPGRNGCIFPGGDPDALANCFVDVLQDQDRCAAMGRASQEILTEWNRNFDVVRGYENALAYAMSRHKR